MSITWYVDPAKTDDSGDGLSWGNAKKTIQGALDLITGVLTTDTYIKLKNATHTADVSITGIACVGHGCLIFEPEVWNDTNYNAANADPFNASNSAGTFNEEADNKPAILDLQMSIENSQNVEFRGLKFLDADESGATNHVIYIRTRSTIKFTYCRFEGFSAGFNATYGIMTMLENCYLKGQQIGILCSGSSQMALMGKCHIIDAVYRGIFAAIDSTIMILPWFQHARTFNQLTIKTTEVPYGSYAAIEAGVNTTIYIQIPAPIQISPSPIACKLVIHHETAVLNPDHIGIILNSRALLTGKSRITFTMVNLNNEIMTMPENQQIVATGEGVVTSD